jgi:hypothetical protein
MSMPGFSAEASHYSRSARYQARVMLAGLRQAGEIVPSLRMECDWDVDATGELTYCCLSTHRRGFLNCCFHPSYGGITCDNVSI